jgi:hypothetical protein
MWELSTGVVTLVSCTFNVTATGIERKQLLNHRSGKVYPLLFKANFLQSLPLTISSSKTACLVSTNNKMTTYYLEI